MHTVFKVQFRQVSILFRVQFRQVSQVYVVSKEKNRKGTSLKIHYNYMYVYG